MHLKSLPGIIPHPGRNSHHFYAAKLNQRHGFSIRIELFWDASGGVVFQSAKELACASARWSHQGIKERPSRRLSGNATPAEASRGRQL